jgi:hypothetical protein
LTLLQVVNWETFRILGEARLPRHLRKNIVRQKCIAKGAFDLLSLVALSYSNTLGIVEMVSIATMKA